MDRDYIQLCAEMAYNEVIFEGCLNDEILIESSFSDRITSLFKTIKAFIIKIYNKVKDFIMNKIKELKAKIEAKKQQKETKQESTEYNRLMNLVITENSTEKYLERIHEAGIDYEKVLNDFTNEIIDRTLIEAEEACKERLAHVETECYQIVKSKNNEDDIISKLYSIKDHFNKIDLDVNDCKSSKIKDVFDRMTNNYINIKDANKNSIPSDAFINTCYRIAKTHEQRMSSLISLYNHFEKDMNNKYRELEDSNDKVNANLFSTLADIYKKFTNAIGIIEQGYTTACTCIISLYNIK